MSAHDLPLPALLAAFAVTATAGWLAGGRRRGVPAIGTGLLAVQGALHLIFSGAGPGGQSAEHHQHQYQQYEAATTAMDTDAGMLAAHLLAAAVCALWLARGEAAFFRLAQAIGTLAFAPLRLLLTAVRLPEAVRPPVRHRSRTPRFHGVVLAHTLVRRGPPALPAPLATAPGAAV
ncbi:hypothetical protein [Streptomyces lunaelactis]|uniref:hypothetical protein n=2 Tax=Streptomyces lunaelactis TaxID=1535768 RepID=UPI001FE96A98|nr:hypothetical protein [Streptomyces lunaelactis]